MHCRRAVQTMLAANRSIEAFELRHFIFEDTTIGAGLSPNKTLHTVDLYGSTWQHKHMNQAHVRLISPK